MNREQIMKKYNCNYSAACIIEKIVTVKEHNENCHPDNKVPHKSGYVMPCYHGWTWRKSKKELIEIFT